ncbi:transmembrane protein 81 [Phaenicophaeus curvirostris]|uniref:transmembrane protein 81 n=1 Tax=Phaenicophaeus curvirostris TaxID=33595 RepID=UPI0037F0E7A0
MKTLWNSPILGMFPCAFYLPLVASGGKVTIPAELMTVAVKVAVKSTPCSVTCGMGFRLEELCEVTPDGEKRNCALRRTDCLTNWLCGIVYFTVPVGESLQISCLTLGADSFTNLTCKWGLAHGLITTKDELFEPFENPNYFVKFSPVRESNAGTYRCDVQMLKTLKIIKRIYFGVRVIWNDFVELNFQKYLTEEQKLAANKEGGSTGNNTYGEVQEKQHLGEKELIYEYLVGIGSGVAVGVLVIVALCYLKKILRRRAVKKQAEV